MLLVVLVLPACTGGETPRPSAALTRSASASVSPSAPPLQPSEPFDRTLVVLSDGDDEVELPVYDAAGPAARQRGLMEREDLPDGTGMVFRFPEETSGAFWMWQTPLPLSIAFFDADGAIVALLDMQPCLQPPSSECPRYDPGASYVGALEVEQGTFDELGVDESWTVEVPGELPPAS